MNERPDAAELLRTARRNLLESVLPRVPEELRYTTLMIANAMAISEREIAGGDAAARTALARVRTLLGEAAEAGDIEDVRAALDRADRRLAAAIREGRFDGEQRAALMQHLLETAVARVSLSNPKVLDT